MAGAARGGGAVDAVGQPLRHDGPMRRIRTAWLVTTAVVAAVTVTTGLALLAAYRSGYDVEVGNRDEAERILTGVYVALPWIALLTAELLAVIVLGLWRAAQSATGAASREVEGTVAREN